MVAPALILLLAFVVVPLFIGAYTSLFQTTSMTGGGTFIGLKNYVFALQDDVFWLSIKNTLYYAVFITIAKNALGLGLALLLAKKMRGLTLFRVAVFIKQRTRLGRGRPSAQRYAVRVICLVIQHALAVDRLFAATFRDAQKFRLLGLINEIVCRIAAAEKLRFIPSPRRSASTAA